MHPSVWQKELLKLHKPDDVVIVGAVRTPQGRLKGQFASLTAVDLGATAIRGALEQAGVPADKVGAVLMGQVLQGGAGQNPARQSSLKAGIPWNVPTMTLNKVCLSGLAAVIDAARLIRLGEAEVVVAGGQESMTLAPHVLMGSRSGWQYGSFEVLDTMERDGLSDAMDGESMGLLTEKYNQKLGISREAQDEVAALSHQRSAAAAADGTFAAEVVAVEVPQRRGEPLLVTTDEGIRPDTTVESLSSLRPAFSKDGTITAGTSSQISDGAAAVVLAKRETAEKEGWPILAIVRESGQVAGPDNSLQAQPANAIKDALRKAKLEVSDLDFIEINEAFASVVVHSARDLGVTLDLVNVNGGGISLGHPIGASGARVTVHAAHELARRGKGRAAVALCGGGGQGDALILEAN